MCTSYCRGSLTDFFKCPLTSLIPRYCEEHGISSKNKHYQHQQSYTLAMAYISVATILFIVDLKILSKSKQILSCCRMPPLSFP